MCSAAHVGRDVIVPCYSRLVGQIRQRCRRGSDCRLPLVKLSGRARQRSALRAELARAKARRPDGPDQIFTLVSTTGQRQRPQTSMSIWLKRPALALINISEGANREIQLQTSLRLAHGLERLN